MKMHLSTDGYPAGRALLFARRLIDITGCADGLQITERLFDSQHSADKPAVVFVADDSAATKLIELCGEYGITISRVIS